MRKAMLFLCIAALLFSASATAVAQSPFLIQSYGYAVDHEGNKGFATTGGLGHPLSDKMFVVAQGELIDVKDGVIDFGANAVFGYSINEHWSLLLLGGWRQNQVDTTEAYTSTSYGKAGFGFAYFFLGSAASPRAEDEPAEPGEFELVGAFTGMIDYTPGKNDWTVKVGATFAAGKR